MADNVMNEQDDDELIPVETPPQDQEDPQPQDVEADEDDEDDEDARLAQSEDDSDDEISRQTNHDRRAKRRERQKRARDAAQRELQMLRETVAALSESEISTAAEYFAGRVRNYNLQEYDEKLAERGAVLHERHCGACHVPPHDEDVAYAIGIPLHGQRPDYIRYAIGAYLAGKREPLLDTMAHEIQQLEAADIDALVNYYSSYRDRN